MCQRLFAYAYFILFIGLLFPNAAVAKKGIFSNPVQLQSLNNLSDIIDDAKRMNLRRSSQSLHLTLNRLQTAIQQNLALGNIRIKDTRQNAYRPYAFIQSSIDRRKLIKSMSDLKVLHQQYRGALHTKNLAQQKQLKRSIHRQFAELSRIKNNWRSKVGKVGFRKQFANKNIKICRNLLPHEKYYSQWESCCDLGNNKSRWLNRATNKVNNWKGSCRSWGMR